MGRTVHELLAALTLWTAPAEELVRWEAPAGCPSQRELTAAIAANLGRPLAPRDAAALTATARARRRTDARWELSLTLVPRTGAPVERTAIAEQCSLLADTAALIVAVALDPTLAGIPPPITPTSRLADEAPLAVDVPSTRADAPSPTADDSPTRANAPSPATGDTPTRAVAPSPNAADTPARAVAPSPTTGNTPARADAPSSSTNPPPTRDRAPSSSTQTRDGQQREVAGPPTRDRAPSSSTTAPTTRARALQLTLAVAAALDVGALPTPAPGLLVHAGLLTPRLRLELGALHFFERPARLPGTAIGGDIRLTAAHLLACPRLALRRVELPVCAGVELGAMAGEGVGLPVAATDRIPWLAASAEARALWLPIPRLAVGLHLGLAVPLLTARFRIDGVDPDLHRAAPVAFRGALGLELRIF